MQTPIPQELVWIITMALVPVVSWVIQRIKLVMEARGRSLGREQILIGLFAVAAVVTYFWQRPALPAFPGYEGDPLGFVNALVAYTDSVLVVATAFVGAVSGIYDLLLRNIFIERGFAPTHQLR